MAMETKEQNQIDRKQNKSRNTGRNRRIKKSYSRKAGKRKTNFLLHINTYNCIKNTVERKGKTAKEDNREYGADCGLPKLLRNEQNRRKLKRLVAGTCHHF